MNDDVGRGASEESSGAPLAETEREPSQRPPSQPADDDAEFQSANADIPRGHVPPAEPTD